MGVWWVEVGKCLRRGEDWVWSKGGTRWGFDGKMFGKKVARYVGIEERKGLVGYYKGIEAMKLNQPGPNCNTAWEISLLSKIWVGHQPQQRNLNTILAGNLFLLSNTCLRLASCCAYRLYGLRPDRIISWVRRGVIKRKEREGKGKEEGRNQIKIK